MSETSSQKRQWRKMSQPKRRRITRAVCERDGWRCRFCGRDLLGSLDDFYLVSIDHLRPTSAGGHPTDLDNLVCSCAICNGLKDRAIVDSPDAARVLIERRKRRRLADYREARRKRRRAAVRRLAAVLLAFFPFVPLDRPAEFSEMRRENVVIPG